MGNAASKKGSCGTQMSTAVVGASYCLERIHLQLIKTYIYIYVYTWMIFQPWLITRGKKKYIYIIFMYIMIYI